MYVNWLRKTKPTLLKTHRSSRVKAGTGAVDVCELASHGVKKTKKRLLFFSSECLEKLYLFFNPKT